MSKCKLCGKPTGADWKDLCLECFKSEKAKERTHREIPENIKPEPIKEAFMTNKELDANITKLFAEVFNHHADFQNKLNLIATNYAEIRDKLNACIEKLEMLKGMIGVA